jgi:hypothetical protein
MPFSTLLTLFSTIYVKTLAASGRSGRSKRCAYAPCMRMVVLPKNTAAKKSRLNSTGLIQIKALAHNLFHKICEEARDTGTSPGPSLEPRLKAYEDINPAKNGTIPAG